MVPIVADIYQHKNYGGLKQQIGVGVHRGETLTIGEFQLSSLYVPLGITVHLYESWDCSGPVLGTYMPGFYPYVGDDRNDKTRSIWIEDFSVFYTSTKAAGNWFDIHQVWDIPPGCTVQFWETTKAGNAKWTAKIENGKFYIDIMLNGDGGYFPLGTWCGVAAKVVDLSSD